MGFVESILSFVSPVAALFGGIGGEDEGGTQTIIQEVQSDDTSTTSSAEQEKRRKNALIQANAGTQTQSPLQNEDTEVTKKTLLGL